jgi:hypothetical protein
MPKRILTMEDLVQFCKSQKIYKFDAKEYGQQVCVRVDNMATFEEVQEQIDDGFMHLVFKVCHAGENRNMSKISKENLEKYKNTINYRPVLASIIPSPDDSSVLDFNSHDIEFDDNGNPIYIEKQVGCFTNDEPFLQYDEEQDKTYLMAKAVIPLEYTASADIIRRKGGTKVSCEISIDNMSYDENTGILDIIDFSFLGVCLLGDHVTEGMAGSRADIESFAEFNVENNSVMNKSDNELNNKLFEILEKLNATISNFNIQKNDNQEGVNENMDKLNELLEAYELTLEELDFSTEGLSDEELENAFTEAFGDAEEFKKKKKCASKEDEDSDDEDFAGCGGKKKKKRCSLNKEDGTIEFELSHDSIRMALYSLLESDWNDNSYSWICEVYDNYFVYQKESWNGDRYESKYYKQSYSKNNDEVNLSGDAVQVFSTFVTESEKTALDMIRSQYDELKKFHDDTVAAQEQAQKDEIFNDEQYAILADNEKFEQLKKDASKFSVDEISEKCKVLFAEEIMAKGSYSADGSKKSIKKIGFNFSEKSKKQEAYAGLFDK